MRKRNLRNRNEQVTLTYLCLNFNVQYNYHINFLNINSEICRYFDYYSLFECEIIKPMSTKSGTIIINFCQQVLKALVKFMYGVEGGGISNEYAAKHGEDCPDGLQ